MPELKVFYCLFLLTLLNATSQIRPSLHGHNNGEHFSRSLARSFSLPLFSPHDYFDADRSDSHPTITIVCVADNVQNSANHWVRDGVKARYNHGCSGSAISIVIPHCDEGHVAHELYAPSTVTRPMVPAKCSYAVFIFPFFEFHW